MKIKKEKIKTLRRGYKRSIEPRNENEIDIAVLNAIKNKFNTFESISKKAKVGEQNLCESFIRLKNEKKIFTKRIFRQEGGYDLLYFIRN
jgi:hypothetical protein